VDRRVLRAIKTVGIYPSYVTNDDNDLMSFLPPTASDSFVTITAPYVMIYISSQRTVFYT
jgi:hypothetical protein